jgi:hypothetical protein
VARSTRLVELSSPVSPETLAESTEACQLRPKMPFRRNELINSVLRQALLVFQLVTASPVMTKSRAPAGGNNYPENGLVKPPRRDTRGLSPAGMFGGKAPLRLAAQKSRPHAPSVPMRSAPAYFLCKWGVQNRLDQFLNGPIFVSWYSSQVRY